MTDAIVTIDENSIELRGKRSLKRSGSMHTAMRVYERQMWQHGDERLALARIGRQAKTLDGYKRKYPKFATEVEAAKEHHREQARGAVIGMLPKAVEVFTGSLIQEGDLRLAHMAAVAVMKNEGVLGKEKQPEQEQKRPRVTSITYMDHPTFNAPEPPAASIPTDLADDDDS